MIDIKRILVPVDFSEPSKKAVNYGLSLALQFEARLVLTHIVPTNVGMVYTFPTESFAFEKDAGPSPTRCRDDNPLEGE
jgi:nucleotide-binding universal stress UspA family protein